MDYSSYELDFSEEGRRRVYAFSYIRGYSRRQYLHFVDSQDFATTIREHIRLAHQSRHNLSLYNMKVRA